METRQVYGIMAIEVYVMKLKRGLFLLALLILFGGCFYVMNQHYDELARYPFELNEKERAIVLDKFDTEQINYLVTQKIEPQQFLPFIKEEEFQLENTLWYTRAMDSRKEEPTYIVNFINKYRDRMDYASLQDLLKNYSYNVLTRFYDEGYEYASEGEVSLIADPTYRYTLLDETHTVYTYEPSDLVAITSLPHDSIVDNANDIMIKKEVVKPLESLMKAAKDINQKDYGDMTITTGYLSYEDQVSLMSSMQKKYPGKDFLLHWDYPGQSEYQLGYTITLAPNTTSEEDKDKKEEADKEQATWIKENAYKYGFVVRYPKQKESITHKLYQPFTLRYVGKEMAKHMYDQEKAMEEVNFEIFEK